MRIFVVCERERDSLGDAKESFLRTQHIDLLAPTCVS